MKKLNKKTIILTIATLTVISAGFWYLIKPKNITTELNPKIISEKRAYDDFSKIPVQDVVANKDNFTVEDDGSVGLKIEYPNRKKKDEPTASTTENNFKISFNKDLGKGIEVKLDKDRTISIKNLANEKYKSEAVLEAPITPRDASLSLPGEGRGEVVATS